MSAVRYSGNVVLRISLSRIRGWSGKMGWFYLGKLRAPRYAAEGVLSLREVGVSESAMREPESYDKAARAFLSEAVQEKGGAGAWIEKHAVKEAGARGMRAFEKWEILRVQQAPCPLERELEGRKPKRDPSTIVVFHGTRRPSVILREGFVPSKGGEFGPGVYFTENPHTASFYAHHVASGNEKPSVLETRVILKKPFTIRKVDWIKKTSRSSPRTIQNRLQKQGFDSIIGIAINDYERQIVVFDTSNIIGPTRLRT